MRVVDYGVRVLAVVEELERSKRSRRIVDQLTGSGTSSGANLFEASEAISQPDFLKTIGLSAKELNETRFWLLLVTKAHWIPEKRVTPLLGETMELLSIIKSIIVRTKRKGKR